MGVKAVPYINGHLIDTVTNDWNPILGQKASVKLNRRLVYGDFITDEHPVWSKDPPVLNITQKDFVTDFKAMDVSYGIDP
jgi:hypothetical protein